MLLALAQVRPAADPDESVTRCESAIAEAAGNGAHIVCFPEAYMPGYRGNGYEPPAVSDDWLMAACKRIATAAKRSRIAVIGGTERLAGTKPVITSLIVDSSGETLGFQDKVQIAPEEESTYAAGSGRRVFTTGPLTFGVVTCHEGFRYPETTRWAARHGAQVVFHPHFLPPEPGLSIPSTFGDGRNSFYEKSMSCRAAENACYFASVNCAIVGSPTTSAVINPDASLNAFQAYGVEGVLIAEIDLAVASRIYARRQRSLPD